MACGEIECEIEEIVEQHAQKMAGRAFMGVEDIRNKPEGVDKETAFAWCRFWNECVSWILAGNEKDSAIYKATPVENDGAWGIRTGKGVSKFKARGRGK